MKRFLFVLLQCTWGLPQTLAGLVVYLLCRDCPRGRYHGAFSTRWHRAQSLSLGQFIFVTDALPSEHPAIRQLFAHEYGHCLQSLLLGPLYLPLIALPSALWCNLRWCENYRKKHKVSYYSFFVERWANRWAEGLLKENTPR